MLFIFDKVKCLIENKNVQTLKKEEIINKIKTHINISNTEFKINVKNLESIGISKHDIRSCNGIKAIQDAFLDS